MVKGPALAPGEKGFHVLSRGRADNFEKLSSMAVMSHLSSRLPIDMLLLGFIVAVAYIFSGALFQIILAAACLLLIADFAYSFLFISGFVYTLEGKCLLVRKGVITYSYTLIPYENVQDVHLVQSITDRIFGVWSVIIFTATATAAGSEQVIGLSKGSAERFRESIFRRIKEAKHVTD